MSPNNVNVRTMLKDVMAGIVVFFVALPLCLGIAQASNAPLFSGLLSGIIGGFVVGLLSRSSTSVTGPAAGLTAVVALEITKLGSFENFLLAVVIAGVLQIAFAVFKVGALSAFVPNSVIKGLLAAIGIILILKQFPHLLGHDTDPEGEMSFSQPDHQNTFTELYALLQDLHLGAAVVGLVSLGIILLWDKFNLSKKFLVPSPLLIVVFSVIASQFLKFFGNAWTIGESHLVDVPVSDGIAGIFKYFAFPNFAIGLSPAVYLTGLTLAIIASLETLLNIEAVDKLDPKQRSSPPNRELFAQGVGNICAGMCGGIPMTSVIVRSSANIQAGAQTKLSTIVHGILLLVCVVSIPGLLNMIPKSALAAILLALGYKLANPKLFAEMWREGKPMFLPFMVTIVAIVTTDLMIGILIGLAVSAVFILRSYIRRPVRAFVEKHVAGELHRLELGNQMSFLNRASLEQALNVIPAGGDVLLDARSTDYIDPDIVNLIEDFKNKTAPARKIRVSLTGFGNKHRLKDQLQFVDYTSYEVREKLTQDQILSLMQDGNVRFLGGHRLTRDFGRSLIAGSAGQHPLASVLSCMDSRSPAELIFDMGIGDLFNIRIAGNVTSPKILGSLELATKLAGARLILVLGHTACSAVGSSLNYMNKDIAAETNCPYLAPIMKEIQSSIDDDMIEQFHAASDESRTKIVNELARRNVIRSVNVIVNDSATIHRLVADGRVAIVPALYDIASGQVEFMRDSALGLAKS